jgi:hypothetical protein
MAKQNRRKSHIPCVWNCGRWGKSKREPICQECKRRESESSCLRTELVYRTTESNGPDKEICNEQIKAEHKTDCC